MCDSFVTFYMCDIYLVYYDVEKTTKKPFFKSLE